MSTRKISRTSGIPNAKAQKITQRAKTRNLSIDGESKVVITPVFDTPSTLASKKQSIVEDVYTLHCDPNIQNPGLLDHSQCNQIILDLKEEIKHLKKDKISLEIDIRVISAELSLSKQEKEKLDEENSTLKNTNDSLVSSNTSLANDCDTLTETMMTNKNKWLCEKDILEKTVNEIRKELETKIIEIRAKHRAEVLDLEEKNRLLKVRLSDMLKINSWERQQELDRISSDLEKSLANEENLKIQLSRLITQLKEDSQYCMNCRAEIKGVDASQPSERNSERNFIASRKISSDIKYSSKDRTRKHNSAEGLL